MQLQRASLETVVTGALESPAHTQRRDGFPQECLTDFEWFCYETTMRSRTYLTNRVQTKIVDLLGTILSNLGFQGMGTLASVLALPGVLVVLVGGIVVAGIGLLLGLIGPSDLKFLWTQRDCTSKICEILSNARAEWESYQPGINHQEEITTLMNRLVVLIVEDVFVTEVHSSFRYQTPKQVTRTLIELNPNLQQFTRDIVRRGWDGQKVMEVARKLDFDLVRTTFPSVNADSIGEFMETARSLLANDVLLLFKNSESVANLMVHFQDLQAVEAQLQPIIDRCRVQTAEILSAIPSSTPGDKSVIIHVLAHLSQQMGKEVVFFDSSADEETRCLPDGVMSGHAALHEDSQMVDLRLHSLRSVVKEACQEEKIDEREVFGENLLNRLNLVVQGEGNSNDRIVIRKLKEKLATIHGVSPDDIQIKRFYKGCDGVEYTVNGLSKSHIEKVQREDIEGKLKQSFDGFLQMKIHPLFYRNYFDLSMFDERGNKCFTRDQTFEVGPPGNKQSYTQPKGWHRYGLKVLGRYTDDKWLHPFGNDGMWFKAYHGTRRAGKDAYLSALAGIYKTGFRVSNGKDKLPDGQRSLAVHGEGVYCSPNVDFVLRSYCPNVRLPSNNGENNWKFVIMVAVRPGKFTKTSDENIWVVPDPQDVRPYGYLVKKE